MTYSKMILKLGKRIARKQFNQFLENEKRRMETNGEMTEIDLFDSGLKINVTGIKKRLIEILRDKRREKEGKGGKKR